MSSAKTDLKRRYGSWAVIAGASDGTGAAFAEQFAEAGINVLLVARRAAALEDLGARLAAAHGVQYRVLVQDLAAPGAAEAMLAASKDLDVGVYVSNAGVVGAVEKFLDNSLEDARAATALNVTTLVEAAHGFGLRMRERGSGAIIVMASVTAFGGRPLFTMYTSTKAFEMAFAESLWAELRDENVDVLGVIAPGMNTPTTQRSRGSDKPMPYHQAPADVVSKAIATLGNEPLVYFPLPSQVEEFEGIAQKRKIDLLEAARWAGTYKEMLAKKAS